MLPSDQSRGTPVLHLEPKYQWHSKHFPSFLLVISANVHREFFAAARGRALRCAKSHFEMVCELWLTDLDLSTEATKIFVQTGYCCEKLGAVLIYWPCEGLGGNFVQKYAL